MVYVANLTMWRSRAESSGSRGMDGERSQHSSRYRDARVAVSSLSACQRGCDRSRSAICHRRAFAGLWPSPRDLAEERAAITLSRAGRSVRRNHATRIKQADAVDAWRRRRWTACGLEHGMRHATRRGGLRG